MYLFKCCVINTVNVLFFSSFLWFGLSQDAKLLDVCLVCQLHLDQSAFDPMLHMLWMVSISSHCPFWSPIMLSFTSVNNFTFWCARYFIGWLSRRHVRWFKHTRRSICVLDFFKEILVSSILYSYCVDKLGTSFPTWDKNHSFTHQHKA